MAGIFDTVRTGVFNRLGLGPQPLLPSRSLFETACIAADPMRQREYSLAAGTAVVLGTRAAASLVPPVLRAWQNRNRPLGEILTSFREPQAPVPMTSFHTEWLNALVSRHPTAWITHPHVQPMLLLADQGQFEEMIEYARQNSFRFDSFLRPLLSDLFSQVRITPIDLKAKYNRTLAPSTLQEQFPISRFGKSNLRGVKDYDKDLFGADTLDVLGARVRPEETRFWKIVERLPPGAHVADWGSGAGIFGHELIARRPDLRVTSVDLFPPEDILSHAAEPPLTAETLRQEMDFLIGNAEDVSLEAHRRADLLVSVFLIPWVPQPLSLFAHMYNQVKPGGLMVATLHAEAYDADRVWGERSIAREISEDLHKIGVPLALLHHDRTIVLRRPDERRMDVAASMISSTYEEVVGAFNALGLYRSFYRQNPRNSGRWVSLA